ncbi:MAG: DUF2059 domain-containing protein [Rhodobacteraceae bacterium]|nr:DUF2059 domain-containing protein [Paracoccaceae bacterium]
MIRIFAATVIYFAGLAVAAGQSLAPINTLVRALGLPETIEIMREEGMGYGLDLQKELLEGRGGTEWKASVSQIYDTGRMYDTVRNRMDMELAAEDLAPMIAYFASEPGRRVIALEVSARRALLDAGVEEASKEALQRMIKADDPRLALLEDFIAAGDLVEYNVVGAMNSNYAFFIGLADGDAFLGEMTEEMILTDVWSQEEAIRTETEEWLYSYLAMAYQPLSDEELTAYTAFFRTPEGMALNHALFAGFDEMFAAVSVALGQAASQYLAGEEL